MFTYDDNLFSDYHKEALGFRPSAETYAKWSVMTPESKQSLWDHLCKVADYRMNEEKRREEEAIVSHEATIKEYMRMFELSCEDALRWDMESYPELRCDNDEGFYNYLKGLPYWYKTPKFEREAV